LIRRAYSETATCLTLDFLEKLRCTVRSFISKSDLSDYLLPSSISMSATFLEIFYSEIDLFSKLFCLIYDEISLSIFPSYAFSTVSTLNIYCFLSSMSPQEIPIVSAVSPLSPVSIQTLILASLNSQRHCLTLSYRRSSKPVIPKRVMSPSKFSCGIYSRLSLVVSEGSSLMPNMRVLRPCEANLSMSSMVSSEPY